MYSVKANLKGSVSFVVIHANAKDPILLFSIFSILSSFNSQSKPI